MQQSTEVSYIGPRDVKVIDIMAGATDRAAMDQAVASAYADLNLLGIDLPAQYLTRAAESFGLDATEPLNFTTASVGVPIQYLQNVLPGFVAGITQARKIDQLIGIQIAGKWEDEEVVQGILELTGRAVPYGDSTNIPFSSYNANWERRSVVRFEEGLHVGKLEEARMSRAQLNSGETKRKAAANALDVERNRVGFYGYNNGTNRTYGLLNDPNLPAYTTLPNGASSSPLWSSKTYLEIIADIRGMYEALRIQSGDNIDPETANITLLLATNSIGFLGVTSTYGASVRQWMRETYPNTRVISAPELNLANGGANVAYMYAETVNGDGSTDDSRTIVQVVPTKFKMLGAAQLPKEYVEDYTNATAGVLVKRPFAIVRRSGM